MLTLKCNKHPDYAGKGRPDDNDCLSCWTIYLARQDAIEAFDSNLSVIDGGPK